MTIQTEAQAALEKSDITVVRCYETGTQLPVEWVSYRKSLRNIINGSDTESTVLPSMPDYPKTEFS